MGPIDLNGNTNVKIWESKSRPLHQAISPTDNLFASDFLRLCTGLLFGFRTAATFFIEQQPGAHENFQNLPMGSKNHGSEGNKRVLRGGGIQI